MLDPLRSEVEWNRLCIFQQELLCDKDEDGNTPLMLAIESGSHDAAMLLVDRGILDCYLP